MIFANYKSWELSQSYKFSSHGEDGYQYRFDQFRVQIMLETHMLWTTPSAVPTETWTATSAVGQPESRGCFRSSSRLFSTIYTMFKKNDFIWNVDVIAKLIMILYYMFIYLSLFSYRPCRCACPESEVYLFKGLFQ